MLVTRGDARRSSARRVEGTPSAWATVYGCSDGREASARTCTTRRGTLGSGASISLSRGTQVARRASSYGSWVRLVEYTGAGLGGAVRLPGLRAVVRPGDGAAERRIPPRDAGAAGRGGSGGVEGGEGGGESSGPPEYAGAAFRRPRRGGPAATAPRGPPVAWCERLCSTRWSPLNPPPRAVPRGRRLTSGGALDRHVG